MPRPSRVYLYTCAVVGLALAAVYVGLASREWFFGEDFYFLRAAEGPRDWWSVFLPLEERSWWSYRPLTIEVYYSTLRALFGVKAFPFLLTSIAAQLGAGLLVFRLARQLCFDPRVGMMVALLSVALYPSLSGELFWTSAFQTVGVKFFYLLTLTVFVDFLVRGGRLRLASSVGLMLLTLLSGEVGMTLPGPLALLALYFEGGPLRARVGSAFRAVAPHVLLLGLYLPFRYLWLGPSVLPMPAAYEPHLGIHNLRHVGGFLWYLAGARALRFGAVSAVVALGWIVAARAGAGEIRRLAKRTGLLFGFLFATMVPFLGMWFVHHRAAIIMEAPFCLLLGAHLDTVARATPRSDSRILEAGLVLLLLAMIPYGALLLQARVPRGVVGWEIATIVDEHQEQIPDRACVDVVPRPEDAWRDGDLNALRFRAHGVLDVTRPGARLRLPNPAKPRRRMRCRHQFVIEVLPGPPEVRPTFRLRPRTNT